MTTALQPLRTKRSATVVSLDGRHARVALFAGTSRPIFADIERGTDGSDHYLLRVIREVGDAEIVSVVGSDPARLAFERTYVAINARPERLRDASAEASQ